MCMIMSGRCSFVGEDGHLCGATRSLQFAHVHPWAKGGGHSAENLTLRCPAHNAYEAVRDYGAHFIRDKQSKRAALRVREPIAAYQTCGSSHRHAPPGTHHHLGSNLAPTLREAPPHSARVAPNTS